jgi:cobalt-precorrin 5A hydrolase/precorrin-3B C17-methyltransferase
LWLQQPEQDRPSFDVHPGISALQLTAVRRNQERCFTNVNP